VNKHEFQIGELDKHKLKVIVLHNDIGKEVSYDSASQFVATDSVSVA